MRCNVWILQILYVKSYPRVLVFPILLQPQIYCHYYKIVITFYISAEKSSCFQLVDARVESPRCQDVVDLDVCFPIRRMPRCSPGCLKYLRKCFLIFKSITNFIIYYLSGMPLGVVKSTCLPTFIEFGPIVVEMQVFGQLKWLPFPWQHICKATIIASHFIESAMDNISVKFPSSSYHFRHCNV